MFINDQILIGADPELFVKDKTLDSIVSAHELIEGTKRDPLKIMHGALQIDGMALEFNIDPARELADFLYNIEFVMEVLKKKVHEKNPNLEFHIEPVAHFSKHYLSSLPKKVTELGCEPDYNAYTGKANCPPNAESPMRTASGHIHVGWTEAEDPMDTAHFNDCQIVTKQLDATLFALSPLWDKDKLRRKLYGAKGAFRPKHYGVEYRVLSNRWLISKPLQAWVFLATKRAMELLEEGQHLYVQDQFAVRSPEYLHDVLVNDFNFPHLPGMKRV